MVTVRPVAKGAMLFALFLSSVAAQMTKISSVVMMNSTTTPCTMSVPFINSLAPRVPLAYAGVMARRRADPLIAPAHCIEQRNEGTRR